MVRSVEDIGRDSMNAMDSFKLMLDEHSSEILSMTEVQAMNATEISEALGIPIAACYRRIRLLKQAGMIRQEDKAVSIGGKSVAMYRSTVESAEVVLQDGRLRVFVKANGESSSETVDLDDEPSFLHWSAQGQEMSRKTR